MKVDDILLMAYVDGELDIEERREIEREIDRSPDLAERIELFRASNLPLRDAFAQQKLPPVPDSLTRKIAELARTHASATSAAPPGPAADTASGGNVILDSQRMNVDDTVLMAYVDDELSPQQRQRIEDELRAHAELADKVALLKASRLPYREAFAEQMLPPVPASLVKSVDDLIRAHAQAAQRGTAPGAPAAAYETDNQGNPGANDDAIAHSEHMPPSAPVRSRLRIAPAWLAVAFVGGAFCCGVVLRLAPGVGFNPGGGAGSAATVASSTMGSQPWVQVAANYQQLYSRDTVSHMWPDLSDARSTVDEIRMEDGIALRVPDLSKAGLRFIRVQRLKFHGRPLVQIVYLPQKGDPVALCVIKENKADQSVASQRIDTMNVVTWREASLGYALIGASSDGDLAPLGKQIAERRFDPLFGSA